MNPFFDVMSTIIAEIVLQLLLSPFCNLQATVRMQQYHTWNESNMATNPSRNM